MSNAEQIAAWDGDTGRRWADEADRYTRMLAGFSRRVLDALRPQPGEQVLDIGCGTGDLTLDLAAAVGANGRAVGVDVSTPLVELAGRIARQRPVDNATFIRADAQVHTFAPASFDAAVSRFGVMFFDDPVAAFANVAAALRPGGRLVFVCWQDLARNDWAMVPAAAALEHVPLPELDTTGGPGPFSFADPDHVRDVLAHAGFTDTTVTDAREPMTIGTSVDDTVAYLHDHELAQTLLRDVPADSAARAWAAITDALAGHETADGVVLDGAAWLVTARTRTRPPVIGTTRAHRG